MGAAITTMLNYETRFWRDRVFTLACTGVVLFAVLTLVAMFFFQGGTKADPTPRGYSFFAYPFSALGVLHTSSGTSNYVSATLFIAAMTSAGVSLILFSLAFPQFFPHLRVVRLVLILLGVAFGIASGICFVGVGLAPVNIFPKQHALFTIWGFRSIIAASFFWALSIFREPKYPKRYAWFFVGFGILVAAWLIATPYMPRMVDGSIMRPTSQKIIVYACLFTLFLQSYGARAVNRMSVSADRRGRTATSATSR